jgi:SOS-response transcriptional repressor LexA
MIRPTQSAIIFIQQLGRGLRKTDEKYYLTVIDFIGNYKNNYLIPIALYGDTSYNKDKIRKLISEGSRMIAGESTINFDKITKEKIYASIDSKNMQLLADLKKDYINLKSRLGRMPMMMDFVENETRDPFSFIEYSNSYYNFIKNIDKKFDKSLSKKHSELLELFSKEINNAKRIEESYILKELIENHKLSISSLNEIIFEKYQYVPSIKTIESCISNINFNFIRKDEKVILLEKKIFKFHIDFIQLLSNETFKKFLIDSVNYSISIFNNNFQSENYQDGFILFNKYSRKDVCRLLNWDKNDESTLYGYKIKDNSAPLFVTYKKSEEISSTTKYNDHFINRNEFAWESKSNRTLESNEIKILRNSSSTNLKIYLFIQKSKIENDFYFFGEVEVLDGSVKQGIKFDDKKNIDVPVVHFSFSLKKTAQESIYNYLTEGLIINEVKKRKTPKITQLKIELPLVETKHSIPLYNFHAAAGTFSEMQEGKEYNLISVPERYATEDYFACKVIGESMNKIIPNNSICIFKKNVVGSRSGKILLIENRDTFDPDFNSAFTVKTYSSKKTITEEGWEHNSILLKPNSFDNSFENIILTEDNVNEMRVIGEFVKLLD